MLALFFPPPLRSISMGMMKRSGGRLQTITERRLYKLRVSGVYRASTEWMAKGCSTRESDMSRRRGHSCLNRTGASLDSTSRECQQSDDALQFNISLKCTRSLEHSATVIGHHSLIILDEGAVHAKTAIEKRYSHASTALRILFGVISKHFVASSTPACTTTDPAYPDPHPCQCAFHN